MFEDVDCRLLQHPAGRWDFNEAIRLDFTMMKPDGPQSLAQDQRENRRM
jgi:hypothetical protein